MIPDHLARRCASAAAAFAWCGLALSSAWANNVQSGAEATTATQGGVAPGSGAALETVAQFTGPMPTGVTVSHDGRVFVNFPRWGDDVKFTVAELKNGQPVAYPNETINQPNTDQASKHFISVQSVVVDPLNRLWVLDTGSIKMGPTTEGGPKLVGIDLATNEVFKTITFPQDVALKTTYLNDVRFDLRKGGAGLAYITDSAMGGKNAIIVVNLDTGQSWRKLHGHAVVKAEEGYTPLVEGQEFLMRKKGMPDAKVTIGADGIAISPDGETLYFCPLIGRHLHAIRTAALANPDGTDAEVAGALENLGPKPGASDGLESDAQGRVYLTDYEHNSVHRRLPDGTTELVVNDPRLLWPDTLSVAGDGFLYITANQLHRQPQYQNGEDKRQKPYYLFRVKIDAGPVLLKPESPEK